ncbi:fatty acid desaturase family protein [Streptomyces triticirhizae]|uniref:Fatty acid desaturase n=1 Tax=Streptomyces triticirhizae TaxID=2483353 RepID=A0A3M2LQU8_9ACTN|nr:fatty acid desaturase [Streptomyces triticirhizae]RMI37238.1 fatty acid desaturase [Streptomyces triticirhizae]
MATDAARPAPAPVEIPWGPTELAAMRRFDVRQAHRELRGLFRPRMGVYWTDFLLSWVVAVVAFWATGPLGYLTVPGLLAFAVSVLAVFRCFAFIHEIAHFRAKRSFTGFRVGWNVLFGIPMMVPVFMYDCHGEHHNKRLYGTEQDAEYLPLARMSVWSSVRLLVLPVVLPLFGPYRFGVVTPVSWVVPRVRSYLYHNLSSLKIDLEYQGRLPRDDEKWNWRLQELACLAWMAGVLTLVLTGAVSVNRLWQWAALFATVAVLNSFRLLAAHRYLGNEEEMTVVEQMMDTVNHPRNRPLTELWAPVGLRLHALHHLMPGLPYHNYGEAHRRLVAALPEDSAYRLTESPGMIASLSRLVRESRGHQKAGTLLASRPERGIGTKERAAS